jgi:hypothetical protein
VNESAAEDVQVVMDDVFEFAGIKDFALNYPNTDTDNLWDVEFAHARSHSWILSEDPNDRLEFAVWIDKETRILKFLDFSWQFDSTRSAPVSWDNLFSSLGPPSEISLSIEGTERLDYVNLGVVAIYDVGILYGYGWGTELVIHDNNYVAEVCFDNIPNNSGGIFLTEPFPEDRSQLTPLQSHLISRNFDPEYNIPFEELFEISVEEAVERYLSGEQTCFLSKPLGPAD